MSIFFGGEEGTVDMDHKHIVVIFWYVLIYWDIWLNWVHFVLVQCI